MSSIEENIKYESKPHFEFSFGTTIETKDEYFDKSGSILCSLLRPKLKETFESILGLLYRLKPIRDIDDYMLKFNFDRTVALRHNTDLDLMLQFWFEDITGLMAEAKASLTDVLKTDLLLTSLDRQESDFKDSVRETIRVLQNQPSSQESINVGSDISTPGTLGSQDSADKKKSDDLVTNEALEPKIQIMIVMTIGEEFKHFTLPKAMQVVKEERESCERNFEAVEALRCSIDVLKAINVSNRYDISHWKISEESIKKRSDLWANRQKQQTGQL